MRDSKVGNGFLIREFPVRPLNEGKYVMDYDMPELVVFIYEDHHQQKQHFVKDICIDRVDSTKGTMETVSSNSNGSSEFAPQQNPCIKDIATKMDGGFRDGNSIDENTTKKRITSETQGEIMKNDDYSRSFSLKHWQMSSFLGRIGSRVESQHCAESSLRNSQTQTSSSNSFEQQTDDHHPEETCSTVGPLCIPTSDSTKSESSSHQSNDSKSSTNSFSFPILTPEWKGSPVRMPEADRAQSRKHHRRRKTCFPCF